MDEDKKFLIKNLLSKYTKPIVCAEIGNYTGNSTRFFSENIPVGSTFYSIDIDWYDIDVPESVIRVHQSSLDWNPPLLDFVYIDGDHDPENVRNEIDKYSKVTSTIAGHDKGYVAHALFQQFLNKQQHVELCFDNQCTSWVMSIQ